MGKVLFGILILIVVIYISKKGWIKNFKFPIIKLGYLEHRKGKQLDVSYRRFNGIEKFPFVIEKEKDIHLTYHVTVEAGSVILTFVNGNAVFFEKEFTTDQQGSITYTPSTSILVVTVTGSYTKGKSTVTFTQSQAATNIDV